MKWFGVFIAIAGTIGAAAIAFHGSTKAYTHRYRLTIAIEANGLERVGSSTIEVSWVHQPQWLPIKVPEFVANVRGDAAVIDLRDGRALVALLGPADPLDEPTPPEYRVMRAFGLTGGPADIPEIAKQAGVRRLRGKDIPAFVMFGDRADPRSARLLRSVASEQELDSGIRLMAATIEVTSDPVTREIDKKLPWWSMEGRPAVLAWRAWLDGRTAGSAVEPETLFRKG